jgi:hypothetical protein
MVVCFNQKVIDDEMKDLKVNTEMQVLNHFSQFLLLQLSLLTKLADLNVHKKKRTDVKNGRFYNLTNFFLILRRNEAERKHSAKNHLTTILFSPPIHSACTLPKGLPTSQSQKRTTTHLIPPYLKSKETTLFSFCLFASFFFSFSDQEIVLLPVWGLGQTSALFFLCVPA